MNIKTLLVASTASLFSILATADPIAPEDLLPAPDAEFMSCTGVYGETDEFRIAWSPILEEGKNGPVKKYASEVNCTVLRENSEDPDSPFEYGMVEVNPEALPSGACPDEGDTCSVSVPMVDIFTAIGEAVNEGSIVLDEGTELSDYQAACSAKVKGLNPPGKSQNHPQTKAACQVAETASCPGWTADELAAIGSYAPSRILSDNANPVTGVYIDQEQTYFLEDKGYHINHGAWIRPVTGGYEARYFVQTLETICSTCGGPIEQKITPLTEAEYEICKQELLNHQTTSCPSGYEFLGICSGS